MSTVITRKEFEEKIIARAWQDESFKQELLSNPKVVLEKEGINLPASMELRVVEETPTTFYLVLPVNPDQKEELSDKELESVAGGIYIAIKI